MNNILIIDKSSSSQEEYDKLYRLYKLQNKKLGIEDLDYWCILYDSDENIMAECSVIQYPDEHPDLYEIHDVFVAPEFRGNNYSVLLILNTIIYIKNINSTADIRIKSYNTNISACICYQKIFGDPFFKDDDFIYFKFVSS